MIIIQRLCSSGVFFSTLKIKSPNSPGTEVWLCHGDVEPPAVRPSIVEVPFMYEHADPTGERQQLIFHMVNIDMLIQS